ncbi:MAG: flavodoxin family protein [Candidatus Omnitrophica bacterium]|nr:flavodoxin family protein [Candidatus Omnitrophota bacterium]
MMKKIAVVYHSETGNTQAMAKFIAEGAKEEPGVEVGLFSIKDFDPGKFLEYDGLVIGSPTYYGAMSYEVKKFFDDSVKYHGKFAGKIGGAFSSAANIGGGNETTILDILQAMLIHGMVIQGNEAGDHYGPVSIGSPDERVKKQCKKFGKRISVLVKKL